MEKPLVVEYNKRKYIFHNNIWTVNNLVVSTDLAQRLTRYCIENNLIKSASTKEKEDK